MVWRTIMTWQRTQNLLIMISGPGTRSELQTFEMKEECYPRTKMLPLPLCIVEQPHYCTYSYLHFYFSASVHMTLCVQVCIYYGGFNMNWQRNMCSLKSECCHSIIEATKWYYRKQLTRDMNNESISLCSWKVSTTALNLGVPKMSLGFLKVYSVLPNKCCDSGLRQAMSTSAHVLFNASYIMSLLSFNAETFFNTYIFSLGWY
jgi:hypothetical protein